MRGVAGRVVVIAGATSPSGLAAAAALAAADARVVAIASSRERLDRVTERVPGIASYVCNLIDASAVITVAKLIRSEVGPVDGLLHLVGGWRGGGGLAGQSDEDWLWLNDRIVTTLRNTTRTWYDDLVTSDAGRLAIVSATAATAPTAGTANYASLKSAAETWTMSVANGFLHAQSGNKAAPTTQRAAAAVLVVKALVDDPMRTAEPDNTFPGFTDVTALADKLVSLWGVDAARLNGERIHL
jgi:NADP-dependent 3-hydroxy acid dehydrogenase YdfG